MKVEFIGGDDVQRSLNHSDLTPAMIVFNEAYACCGNIVCGSNVFSKNPVFEKISNIFNIFVGKFAIPVFITSITFAENINRMKSVISWRKPFEVAYSIIRYVTRYMVALQIAFWFAGKSGKHKPANEHPFPNTVYTKEYSSISFYCFVLAEEFAAAFAKNISKIGNGIKLFVSFYISPFFHNHSPINDRVCECMAAITENGFREQA